MPSPTAIGSRWSAPPHSFTGVAVADGVLLRPDRLQGVVAVDRAAMTVTVLAGTPLKTLNADLERLGLSLHDMGHIAEQTIAGAISTGTHGTGGLLAGLSAQVVGLELVTGTGEVQRASPEENADVHDVARLGPGTLGVPGVLGVLGVLITITLRVEPLLLLRASEEPMSWDRAVSTFDEMAAESHHVEMYWFPH